MALIGVIQETDALTSWDDDEYLFQEMLTERGYEHDGRRNVTDDWTWAETIDEWTQQGAAAIVMESDVWDGDAEAIAAARTAGVRFISYNAVPRASVDVDVDLHVGVREDAIARAQLEALVGMLAERNTPKPWRIANFVATLGQGDGSDLQRANLAYGSPDLSEAIDALVEAGQLADAGDVIVHDCQIAGDSRKVKKHALEWLDGLDGLAGIVLADPSTLLVSSLPEELPVVLLDASFDALESVVRLDTRATVTVFPSELVNSVGTALDALQRGTIGQLPTLPREGTATDIPAVYVNPVTITNDNWETALADDEMMLGTLKATVGDLD
ncbi:hypothetical protein GCM10010407_05700 [Rarobacter incanus]